MKKTIYLANVGAQDVQREGKPISKPRIEGQDVLQNFDPVKNTLQIPILESAINHILEIPSRIDCIYLFYTDQDKDIVGEKNWQRDTLYFAEIIKRILLDRFAGKINNVKTLRIEEDPTLYDKMDTFFNKTIKRISKYHPSYLAFVTPVGGIPASNAGLLLNTIKIFKKSCQPIYVSEKDAKVYPLDLGKQILSDYVISLIHNFLKQYNYSAVAQIFEGENYPQNLYNLSKYVQQRLYFNFSDAEKFINKAIRIIKTNHLCNSIL